MAIRTITLASIYEKQGLVDEAIAIYKEILADDPDHKEAKNALFRLQKSMRFGSADQDMKRFFVAMESKEQFLEFERWLVYA